jgi:TPR repeat protein
MLKVHRSLPRSSRGGTLALAALAIVLELTDGAAIALAEPPAPPASEQPAQRMQAQHLHAQGMKLVERGDIDAARKYFERAADAGYAESALALAETYDPYEFHRLKVFGLQPNLHTARKWYLRARELGADADQRLRRLEGR